MLPTQLLNRMSVLRGSLRCTSSKGASRAKGMTGELLRLVALVCLMMASAHTSGRFPPVRMGGARRRSHTPQTPVWTFAVAPAVRPDGTG